MDDTPENRLIAWKASQLVTSFRMDKKLKNDWQWLYDQIVTLCVAAAQAARTASINVEEQQGESEHVSAIQGPPEALNWWARLTPANQRLILTTTWCGTCRRSTTIQNPVGQVMEEDLVLNGRCATCGEKVGRLVEGG